MTDMTNAPQAATRKSYVSENFWHDAVNKATTDMSCSTCLPMRRMIACSGSAK